MVVKKGDLLICIDDCDYCVVFVKVVGEVVVQQVVLVDIQVICQLQQVIIVGFVVLLLVVMVVIEKLVNDN